MRAIRGKALCVGPDPAFEYMGLVNEGAVESAMADPTPRAHVLELTRADDSGVTQVILMDEKAIQNVGENLHVLPRMRRDAGAWSQAIFV